jgi:hypothetical protein
MKLKNIVNILKTFDQNSELNEFVIEIDGKTLTIVETKNCKKYKNLTGE